MHGERKENISRKLKEYYKHNDNFIKGKTFEEAFGEEKAKQIKEILSKCASEKVGEKNPFYGKHHSEETKKKISNTKKGIPNEKQSKKVLQFTLDGEFVREWESTHECERNGFNRGAVSSCCRGKKPHYKGYKWCYK